MKKSLIIISFAFIFLLTLSVVSAIEVLVNPNDPKPTDFPLIDGTQFSFRFDGASVERYVMSFFGPGQSTLMITFKGDLYYDAPTKSESYQLLNDNVYPITNGVVSNAPLSDDTINLYNGDKLVITRIISYQGMEARFIPKPKTTETTAASATSARSAAGACPRGWGNPLDASDGGKCCRKAAARATGRFLGFMFRE